MKRKLRDCFWGCEFILLATNAPLSKSLSLSLSFSGRSRLIVCVPFPFLDLSSLKLSSQLPLLPALPIIDRRGIRRERESLQSITSGITRLTFALSLSLSLVSLHFFTQLNSLFVLTKFSQIKLPNTLMNDPADLVANCCRYFVCVSKQADEDKQTWSLDDNRSSNNENSTQINQLLNRMSMSSAM